MITGIELIADERQQQLEDHKISVQNDIDNNSKGQLLKAARCLIYPDASASEIPENWNEDIWHSMINKTLPERIIISGALLAAELDRLQNL